MEEMLVQRLEEEEEGGGRSEVELSMGGERWVCPAEGALRARLNRKPVFQLHCCECSIFSLANILLFGHLENIAQKAGYGLEGKVKSCLQAECFIEAWMYTKFKVV